MRRYLFAFPLCALTGISACSMGRDRAFADSMRVVVARQSEVMDKLTAQRDSVSRVLGEANAFVGTIDTSISRVKGVGGPARSKRNSEGALEDQVRQRRDMLQRVDALVARARETAEEVAALKQRERRLLSENGQLKDSLSADAQRLALDAMQLAEMRGTIESQAQAIAALQARLDAFDKQLVAERAAANRAYYVIGTEDDLVKKGVIVREGGTNLLIKRIGRTLVPARQLNPEAFTPIDARDARAIAIPDSTKRYEIVSRQSLDDAKTEVREGSSFRGPLEIPDAGKFWAPSRYLIIVQR